MTLRYDPATLLAACPVPMLVLDNRMHVVFASEAARALWPDDALIGRYAVDLLIVDEGKWTGKFAAHIRRAHGRRHFDVQSTAIGPDGNRLLTLHDVSGHVRRLVRLTRIAITDPLTGLANRRGFNRILHAEQRRMNRDGKPLSLLTIDVNGLKIRNDTCGHAAGDLWLCEVATALNGSARRPGDFSARLGGDEFAIILPETDLRGAQTVADRIHALLKEPVGGDARPSVAIGMAMMRSGVSTQQDSLLSAADADLYRNKFCMRLQK